MITSIMNQRIQQKIDQYRKIAKSQIINTVPTQSKSSRTDGLAKVIRSQKDADNFMAELNSVIKQAR